MSSLALYQTPHLLGMGPLYIMVGFGKYNDDTTGWWYCGEYVVLESGAKPLYGWVRLSDTAYEDYHGGEFTRADLSREALRAGLGVIAREYEDSLDDWSEKFCAPWREHVVKLEDGPAVICGFALRGEVSRSHFRAISRVARTPDLKSLAGEITSRWITLEVSAGKNRVSPIEG